MTIQFDTRSFAKRLSAAGEKVEVAEAHAMALKEFVMDTIATKADVFAVRAEVADLGGTLRAEMAALGGELRAEMADLRADVGKVRTEMGELRTELKFDIAASEERLRQEMGHVTTGLKHELAGLRTEVGTLWLKLMTSTGGTMVAGAGVLFGLLRMFPR